MRSALFRCTYTFCFIGQIEELCASCIAKPNNIQWHIAYYMVSAATVFEVNYVGHFMRNFNDCQQVFSVMYRIHCYENCIPILNEFRAFGNDVWNEWPQHKFMLVLSMWFKLMSMVFINTYNPVQTPLTSPLWLT